MDQIIAAQRSPNRAYLATCIRHSAQILLRGPSDTLGTLGEIRLLIIWRGDDV
jgi:hypothetical protein